MNIYYKHDSQGFHPTNNFSVQQQSQQVIINNEDDLRKYAMGPFNSSLVVSSSILTIIGSWLIIITYYVYRSIQTPIRHIIVCISVADLLYGCANLTGIFMEPEGVAAGQDIKCILQSFLGTTFVLSSFLWTIILALSLYIWLVLYKPDKIRELIHPWFHLVCWLIPLAINVVALCLQKLGNSGEATSSGWCWIRFVSISHDKERGDAIMWMFIDGKGLEILTYAILLIFYFRIKIHLQTQINKSIRSNSQSYWSQRTINAARMADKKLLMVPIILICIRIWGTIRFLVFAFDLSLSCTVTKVLISFQAVGDNLQGFTNCVLFCFCTKSVNARIKKSFLSCQHVLFTKPKRAVDMQRVAEREPLLK